MSLVGGIALGLNETIASATIAACGCIGATSIVWYLKKSQAENTVKIYLSAYEKILNLKQKMQEDTSDTFLQMENNILNKLDNNLSNAMDEATSSIEKQDIY